MTTSGYLCLHVMISESILYYNINNSSYVVTSKASPHLTSSTIGYKWLQMVTCGYKWLYVDTSSYSGFMLVKSGLYVVKSGIIWLYEAKSG